MEKPIWNRMGGVQALSDAGKIVCGETQGLEARRADPSRGEHQTPRSQVCGLSSISGRFGISHGLGEDDSLIRAEFHR
jgi:hypothetical protein